MVFWAPSAHLKERLFMIGVVALWNRLRSPVRRKARRRLRSPELRFERYGMDVLEKRQMLAVAPASDFTYAIDNGQVTITRYVGSSTTVEIPATIDSLPVTTIGDIAFLNNASLTSVSIPSGVTTIGGGAFAQCFSLTSVTIPAGVAAIGNNTFFYCTSLTSVTIPSTVTSIGDQAFYYCTSLASVSIAPGVTSIGSDAFSYCDSLVNLFLPSTVQHLGEYAVDGMSLQGIYFYGNAPQVDPSASFEWDGVTTYYLPGASGWTGQYNGATTAVFPSSMAPTAVAGIRGNGQVQLSWTAPVSDGGLSVTDYTIQYSTDGSSWQTFSHAASTATSATVTGLTNGTGYLFRVASVNDVGTGLSSANSSVLTPSSSPDFTYTTSNGEVVITGYTGLAATVEIPAFIDGLPVTSIGDNALFNMSWITSLIIPSGVQRIGFGSFAGTGITTLNLPASVTSFSSATYACFDLATITVDPASDAFVSIDGVLYDKQVQTLIRCPSAREQAVTIPESVTAIGYAAFIHCTKLTTIIGLQPTASIGWDAFSYCNNLRYMLEPSLNTAPGDYLTYTIQSNYVDGIIITGFSGTGVGVVIADSILDRPVVGIGSDAFNGRRSLESIRIPDSVTGIGNAAFANCNSLKSIAIPSGVTYIGFDAFHFCTSLTSITLPASLRVLVGNGFCFYGSSNLVAINVDEANEYFASVDGLLYDKALTSLLECPKNKEGVVVLPSTVTSIGTAFANCTRLSRIVIPEGVTSFVVGAFDNCPAVLETSGSSPYAPSNVVGVRGDGQVQLSWAAPQSDGGSAVTDYIIQYSTDGSSWQSFSHAALISTSVTVTGLANGTGYQFRVARVNDLGMSVYSANSPAVTPATVPSSPTNVVGVHGNSQVALSWTAPSDDGGLSIRDYTIQYSSDSGASWQTFTDALSAATSTTVTGLINGTGYLFRVASVNDLGTGAYSPDSAVVTPVSDFAYTKTNEQVTITGYAGSSAAIEIPSIIDGLPVTAIGDNAFWGLSWITSISIPSGVESIGFGSFAATGITTLDLPASLKSFSNSVYACQNLASIYVDPANSVYVSIDGILYDKSLQTVLRCPQARTLPVTLPETVSAVAANAFAGCTQVTVVNGLQPTASIGWDAFAGCDNLRHVLALSDTTVPGDYLTYTIWTSGVIVTGYFGTGTGVVVPETILGRPVVGIGSDAFNTRSALESIVIPRSVTGIGNAAFANCTNLKSIVIPDQVAYIGFNAFQYCTSLTSISLPASVTHIGAVCFFGCSNLVSIEVDGGNANFASAGGLLYDKTLSTLIDCPEGKSGTVVLPASVTAIGREGLDMTFAECKQLTRIVIPGGVTAIVGRAFENCPAIVETTGASPFAPGNLAGVRGNGQLQLSWTAPVSTGGMSVKDYTVQYSVDGSSWQTYSRTASTATTATVTGLFNGTGYLFRVASVNDVRTGVYSANSAMVTPSTVPDAPAAVIGVRGSGQIQLSWTAPVSNGGLSVADYTIQYSSDSGSSWQTFTDAVSAATSATVTGLTNGTGYLFRVAAVNDVGTGSFTATPSSVTPNAVPLPPTNIVATRGRGVVTVSWTTPVSTVGVRITDYRVQQSTNGGISWVTVGDGVSISTRTVVSGLVMGRDCIFRVAAVGRSGAGDFSSPSAIVTPATVPAAPVGVLATGGIGQVALSWRAPTSTGGSPVSQYIVQYSPSAGRWLTSTTVASNTTTATVGGLLANRSYSFRVLAVNDMGNSPASRVVVARTLRPAVVRV